MHPAIWAGAILAGLWISAPRLATAAEMAEIAPPFGLKWSEPRERLEQAIIEADATIAERRKAEDGHDIWEVKGITQIGLQRVLFHLRAGKLIEVELQYFKDDWSPATYDEFMQRVKKRIEDKHGPGRLMARQTDSGDRGIMKTLVGYRWASGGATVELFYFAAQDPKNLFRTLSLHYKASGDTDPPSK